MTDAETILRLLRETSTVEEVNAIAREHGPTVKAMEADKELAPRAYHIRNLAAYRRWWLT